MQQRFWYIAAILAMAGAIAIQVAAQLVASDAMSAAARGAHGNASLVADRLRLLGLVVAVVGVALWLAATLKHPTPTHTIPVALFALYAFFFWTLV
jgi:hypothetical protein